MLKDHPPQTSSRAALSNWACSIHNIVNARLGKAEFDCNNLENVYQCGCADEPSETEGKGSPNSDSDPLLEMAALVSVSHDAVNVNLQDAEQ